MKTWISRLVIVVLVCFTNLMPTSAQNTLTTLGLTSSNYASVAYSVRQLSTGYTGPLMRIRNSTSGNTYDVWPDANGQFSTTSYISAANPGTTPGTVNGTTALSTITSTANFTVAIWYDQSTNSSPKNLTQTTAANQPTIISSGTIQTENSKPFIRFYGTTGTASVPSSVYNSLNLASTLSTNGHISIVNKFASGGDGFILSHSSSNYNYHSDPVNSKLFDGTYASTSLLNSTVKQNGTTVDRANAVFNTSLGINTIQPQTANSGTDWDNIGTDRVYHRVTGGGGYAELVVFSAALSAANTSLVEGSQKRFFGIAVPTITSLSSYSGDIGSSVTITGTGFDATAANNVVYFGSTKVTPSAATSTSLTVTVPAGAIYAPVSVVNTIANLQAFSQRPFNVTFNGGNSAIAFKPSLNFASSSANIGSSVGADFDGDGKMDLASVINGSNIVNVFRNTNSVAGTPSFGTALALTPGSTCKEGIAVADFNGDGLMDLVVANNGNGTVAVFKNTSTSGTISFASAVTFTVGSTPRNIAVGDFDNDGKMDIACPSSNASNNYLSILRNSGTSTTTISFDAQSTIAMGNAVSSVAAGDLDGDGKTDLIVGNDGNNLPLRVLRNTNTVPGTLSFASYFTIDLAVNTPFVALADFDSDGKLDIVSGNSPIYVVRNISTSGSLSASSFDVANKVSAITGQQALQTVVGDLNGDGKPDISNYSGNAYFTIAKNTTSGSTISFASQQNVFQAYTTAPTIQGGFIGDLDGDNQPDLVSTNYGRTNFTVHSFVSSSISSFSPANGVVGSSVTITGTGFNTTTSNNIVYFGTTIATVTAATATSLTVTVPTGATRAPISVINTATKYRAESKNLFQVNFTGGNNKVMLSNQVVATTGPTYQTAIADFNNDGFADIAVANRATTNKLSVFRNTSSTGASTISLASSLELTVTGTNINGVAASDFDGDGKIDLVCTYYGAAYGAISKLTLYRNTTTAGSTTLSFDTGVDIDLSNIYVDNSMVLKVRDFNGDGRPDILFSANKLVLNNITAPGTFTTTSFVTKGFIDGLSHWPTTGYVDVDGDGFLDLVNSTSNTYFYVKRNTGALGDISLTNDQSFATAFSFSTYSKYFQGGAEGDLDGDGKVDLVFMDDGNTGSPNNQVIVLRNTSTSGTINANSFSSKLTLGPVAGVGSTASGERCWIGLEDMDGDGRLDIIAVPRFTTNSNHTNSPTITVYLNKATSSTISGGAFTTASFSSAYAFGNLGTTTSFSIGDLNNDGKPEIVVGSYANNGFSIFRNYTVDPPTITSLDTYSGAVGSTVVITGTNFSTTAANNLVFFGATQAAVPTSVTSTSLTVTVPTGATYQPVSVTNTENTHIAYSPKPFLVTFTGGSNSVIFKSPVSIATTSAGNAIGSALGDLDGDGKMDLVELLNSGTLTIYRNTSTSGTLTSSSFTKVTDITSAGNYAVKIADIDGDGKMDIVTNQKNWVGVLRNTTSSYGAATPGTISFATIVSTQLLYGLGTNGGLEVADMDGDGKPDIIMSNNDATYSTYIVVAKNTSTIGVINSNSFNLAYSYTTVNQSIGLAVSDLDGDGLRDIAVVNYATTGTNPNSVVVLRNTSTYPTMSFASGVAFTTGTNPISVAIGDIDNDNKPDMVVANYGSTSISLFRNTSTSGTITTGSFAAKIDFTTPANPYAVALADINGDGKLDINVVNQGNASFASIFRNTATDNTAFSSSTLATRVDNTVVTNPYAISIAIGDIDGNGKNDMVVGNGNGTFYLMKYAEPLHTITSFSPTSGNVGATVTITGTNFPTTISNLAVYFGATKATVSAATSTSLTVTVPKGATYQPITVLNIAEGTLVSSVKSFTPTFTGGNNAVFYSKKVDFTSGSSPYRTYLADIDGDGNADLIVPNYSSNTISVFRNTPTSGSLTTGSFSTKVDFAVGTTPYALAISDLDNDGKLDIAVANYNGSNVSILRNTATSGTIASSSLASQFALSTGSNPSDVAIFDVDGDGRSEIVTANYGGTNISVFQNISSPGSLTSSSFASAVNLTSTTQPQSIAVGDFDNDGKIDFAVAAQSSNTVSLFRNTSSYGTISTSSFATKQDITGMPSSPNGIAAGDIDGDGNVDLVVSANAGNTVSLLRNTFTSGTTFSFATKVDISAGSTGNVQGVTLGDLDGDGKLDLVASNQASNTLSFFRNTATSGAAFSSSTTFASMVSFATGTNPQYPAIGDVDGDGKADVAVANYGTNTVSVLRYSTSNAISISNFSPASGAVGTSVTITGTGFNATAANNVIYFGATKVATISSASATSLTVTVPTGATHQPITVLNTTEGLVARSAKLFIPTFTGGNNNFFSRNRVDYTVGGGPYMTYLADIDGDGKSDLVLPNFNNGTISILRNTSTNGSITSSSFATAVDFTVGSRPTSVAIGDLDGDGKLDIATVSSNGNTINILRNKYTSGTFSSTTVFDAQFAISTAPGYTLMDIAMFDVDGDGRSEIITANSASSNISLLQNLSSPGSLSSSSFGSVVNLTAPAYPLNLAVGDFDNDGKMDFAVTTQSTNIVSLFRNTSTYGTINTSSFATKQDITGFTTSPYAIAAGDIDGDGNVDMVTSGNTGNTISLLRNTFTSGTSFSFATKVDITASSNGLINGVALGDLDGDGKIDLVASNSGSNTLSYFKNNSTSGAFSSSTFGTQSIFSTNSYVGYPAIGDIDGDGKSDVACLGGLSGVSVFRNNGAYVNISSFTPENGAVGTSVTITGTGFSATTTNNAVYFGATKATVTAATTTSLTVTVPSGATYQPLTVVNTTDGLVANSVKPFTPTFTGGNNSIFYSKKVDFTTGSIPYKTYLADIDGDGKSDLIVPNRGANNVGNTISVFRNISTSGSITTGSFGSKVDFTVGMNPVTIAFGDLDGDGKIDLAVGNSYSGTVSILRNTSTSGTISSSSFASPISVGGYGIDMVLFDIDGDGRPEIISTQYGSSSVAILQNISSPGSLTTSSFASTAVSLTTTTQPVGLAVGDFDNDGKADIAVACQNSNTISLFRNVASMGLISTSSFATKQDINTAMPTSPSSIASGDIDGDGKMDLVVSANAGNTISLLRNTFSSGTTFSFASKVDLLAGSSGDIQGVALGDMDGDGKLDLLAANYASNTLSFFRNTATSGAAFNSSTTFAPIVSFATGSNPQFPAIGDLDGDGKADVAVVNYSSNTLSVFRYSTSNAISVSSFSPTSGNVGATVTITGAGFNTTAANNIVYFGATKATVSAATATSLTVTVPTGATYQPITVLNSIEGIQASSAKAFTPTFTGGNNTIFYSSKVDFTTASNPNRTYLADIDGDGKSDLIVPNYSSTSISVFRNTSTSGTVTTGSFGTKVDFSVGSNPAAVAISDLDGDGKLDIAVANYSGATVSILRNTATSGTIVAGSFATQFTLSTGTNPIDVAIFDIDGDGRSEIITTNYGSTNISVFKNISTSGALSSSSFASAVNLTTTAQPYSIAVADFDNDGKTDFAVTALSSNTISLFRNVSTYGSILTSSFTTKQDITSMPSSPIGIAAGDIDGDGNVDLVVSANAGNTVSLLRNTFTSGTTFSFATKVDISAGSSGNVQGVSLGDLDGDGKLDLVAANTASSSISFFRNTATSGAAFSSSTFATRITFATATTPQYPAIGDVDGDGKADVVVSNYGSSTVSVFRYSPSMTLSSFTPTSGAIGTTVTITGSGFNATAANNIVYFGATKATVSAASATSLTVTVPAGATFQPINVVNTDNGLTAASTTPFKVTFTGGNNAVYASVSELTSGSNTSGAAIGDFNRDGKSDLVVAKKDGTTTIGVFRNISTSGSLGVNDFATKVEFAAYNGPNFLTVVDLDGDGMLDVALTNATGSIVSLYRNTSTAGSSTISFAAKLDVTVGTTPYGITSGDLDGDGKPELIVANYGSTSVSVLYNQSTKGAAFTSASFATKVDFTTGTNPYGVAVSDLDGDGKLDIAVANYASNTVSVFRNTALIGGIGTSSFASKVDYTTGTNPMFIALGDVNGDSKDDIAVSNYGSNTISLFRNQSSSGAFTFDAKVDYTSGTNPSGIAMNDLDGDGKLDIAFSNYGSKSISVIRNTSTGTGVFTSSTFATKVDFGANSNPSHLSIGDLDGDGKPDLVVPFQGSTTVGVYRIYVNNPPTITSFTPTSGSVGTSVTITGTNFSTTAANNTVYFGATKATVSAASATSLTVTVPIGATYQPISVTNAENTHTGYSAKPFLVTYTGGNNVTNFKTGVSFATPNLTYTMAVGDLDGDGKSDVVVGTDYALSVWRRNPLSTGAITSTSFTKISDLSVSGMYPTPVKIVDIDGDGKLDLVHIGNYASGAMLVNMFRNITTTGSSPGTITFDTRVDITPNNTTQANAGLDMADIDGDGKPDIVAIDPINSSLTVFKNTATIGNITTTSFALKSAYSIGTYKFTYIAIGDIDGDNKPDIIGLNAPAGSAGSVVVLHNTSTLSTISFSTPIAYATNTTPNTVAIGDIDGDGKPDLVVSNNASNNISIFRNNYSTAGTPLFENKVDFTTITSPGKLGLADFDGDGKLDIALTSTSTAGASVLRNTATSGVINSASLTNSASISTHTNSALAIGDFDGNGKNDIITNSYISSSWNFTVNCIADAPPIITSFSPASGAIGTTVTISGSGFDATASNNTVYFGDTKATITAASATSLTVTVPAGASYKPISVLNKTTNMSAYSVTPFKVTFSGGNNMVNFSTKVDFTAGTNPMGVAFGDFDGDGKTDAAVANFAGNNVSVYRNTATSGSVTASSFDTKVDLSTGTGAIAVITGDVDGDGKLDLLVANKTAGTVSVFLNTSTSGTISFATKVDLTTDTSPKYMALGDFNTDGKIDVAVTCEGSFALNVFKNNSTSGSLSFDAKVSVSSTAAAPNAIAVADLDADGKPELVVTSGTTSGTARIFRNTSTYNTIAFGSTTDLTTGSTPYGVTIGDIDGDGLKDIAVANNVSNTMSVFRNTNTAAGTVSFATKIDYTTGTNPYGIAIGDLDGDNKLDLVTANSASSANTVSVFRNTTTGSGVAFSSSTFATKSDFTVGSQPYRVEIADVDGNGRVDVITSNYNAPSISVLWNKLSPSITSTGTITTVCYSAAAQTSALPYTAASENPTAYSITWNAAALTAGLVNVATTNNSFVAGGGSITGIPINAGLAAGTYTGTMTITDGSSSSTLTVTLTVNAAVTAGTISNAQTICSGATPATITSTGVGTGSGTISYEWQTNASGSYVTIAGAVSATYAPSALTATTSYKRRTVAINSGTTCYSDYTTPITITVNPLPNAVITSSSGGFSFNCTVSAPITLSVTPQTGNVYSWKIGTTEVSTTSSVSVSTPAAYTLTVTGTNGCIATSSATVINDYNAASAAVLSGTTSIPRGTSANLQVTITGGTSPFTVVYSDGTTNYTVNNYVSASNIPVSPTVGTNYTLVSVTGFNTCVATGLSGSAYVTVTTGPTSSVISGSTSICTGGSTNISFAITGGTSPYTVVYTNDITNTNVTLTNYVSGTNVSVTPTGSVTTYSIVSVTDATGFAGTGNTGSAVMTVFATTTPTFTSAPGAATCGNTNVTYTTETGMTNYVWTIPGTLNRDYTITSGSVGTSSNSVVLKWITAGSKVVTVNYLDANGCRSTTASSTTQNARAFTSVVLSGSTTITTGSSANLQVAVNGGTGPYTIVLNDGTADFTVSNYYSGPNITVTPTVTTTYTLVSVTGTTGCGSSSSSGSAVITVNSGGVAKTWTGGAGDNLWSSSGNWSPAGTPAGNDLISISSGNPIIDVDFTVGGSLTLSGATTTLTVNPGYSISVASGATVDFGQKDVTFKSTAAGTAQLGRMEGTLSNADSVIVERYFPAGRRAYRFIAPSVTTPSSIRYNWMENATPVYDYVWVYTIVSAYNPKLLYGTHITGNGDNTNGFDRTAVNTSTLYTLNPNTQAWVPVGSTAGTLTAGDAYRILIRGSRSTNLNKNNAWASETTLRAKGTPKTGTVTLSSILSTVGGNWSMVGNPYNALLDLRAASSTNLSPYYHVWDPQRGTRGAYVSYHLSTGYKSNSASDVNEFVQPGQAFFVQTVANGAASLTFEENKKAPAGTQTRVFRPLVNYPVLNVSLSYTDSLANGAPEMDALAVLFDNSFSNNVDANDANKNINQDENMGISRDGKFLSMELRNMYDQSTTIPLNITQYARQNYTLRINWSNPIDAGYDAYIKDNYTGVTQIISFSNPTDYVFTVNSSIAASKAADRFSIMFLPSVALPVSGLELNGFANGKQVKLQFTAINERDMAGYDIERSSDGVTYEKIGFQNAANGSAAARSYAFIDNNPFNGNNYYRIKGGSINGQQQFSNVKLIKVGVGLPTVSVAPNPASNDKLQLKVTQLLKGNYTIIVTDALGRVFCQKEIVYDGVSGKLELKYPSVAKSGSYYVKVNGESGSFTEAFIIR